MSATATFVYRALRLDGGVERGTFAAENASVARSQLMARGLTPLTLTLTESRVHRASLSASDLAVGLRVLANLVSAGVPITRALRAFEDLAPKSWRSGVPHLREQVTQGSGLASALESSPLDVKPLMIGIIRAGEAGAGLATGLRHAADIAESRAAVSSAIKSALAYPIIVAIAGTGSIAVLVGVVLPRFSAVLADFGQRLPPTTRLVLGVADFAQHALLPIVFIGIACLVGWGLWINTDTGRKRWCGILLSLPLIGPTRHAAGTARVSLSLSALLKSGVPLNHALALAGRASGDAAIEERTTRAREHVSSGRPLAESLEDEKAVTLAAVRLIRAGEEGGSLADMLAHAGQLEQDRAERTLKTSVRLIEPVMLLAFAGIVAVVAAALLQAVYSIRPSA